MSVAVKELSRLDAKTAVNVSLNWVERARPGMSAQVRLGRWQRLGSIGALVVTVALLVCFPIGTVSVLITACTVVYLATITHRVLLVRSSLREDPFVHVDDVEAAAYPDHLLPTYTVLVPAHQEPEVVPELIANLERLDYPRDRLQVKLLLEEADTETLEAALGAVTELTIDVILVPPGGPQTKPRALNVGLLWSTGELVTIYDAEDRPEPLQLRKAAIALGRLGPEWACLQARLEFYDTDVNLLTKWFAAEYLTWFTCFLPGLVNSGGVVPLGGTSNHFRRHALVEVGAWDPYNVTEDADLGIRLQRSGYRIGVLDAVTHEEANSDVINWVKQRSRWQKGYLQTALVHLRRPRRTLAELGRKGFALLLLFVLGTPLLAVTNLFFWAMSAVWFATEAHAIEQVFPGWAYYLALFAWGVGNFSIAYLGVLTVMRTRRWELIGAVLLAPAYWVLMSIAGLRAVIQFVVDPHHWEKTAHGLSRPGVAPDVDLTGDRQDEVVIDLRDPAMLPFGNAG